MRPRSTGLGKSRWPPATKPRPSADSCKRPNSASAAAHGLARLYLAKAAGTRPGRFSRSCRSRASSAPTRRSSAHARRRRGAARRRRAARRAAPARAGPAAQQLPRGWALMGEGKLDEAEAQFRGRVRAGPRRRRRAQRPGVVPPQHGDAGQAGELFERHVQLHADHFAATNGLATASQPGPRGRGDRALDPAGRARAAVGGGAVRVPRRPYFGDGQRVRREALPLFEQLARSRCPRTRPCQSGLERGPAEGAKRSSGLPPLPSERAGVRACLFCGRSRILNPPSI